MNRPITKKIDNDYWRNQALRWHDFGWRAEKRMARQEELLKEARHLLKRMTDLQAEALLERITDCINEPLDVIYDE